MMIKKFFLLTSLIAVVTSCALSEEITLVPVKKPISAEAPKNILSLAKSSVQSVKVIDFDGDNNPDYILSVSPEKPEDRDKGMVLELWITAKGQLTISRTIYYTPRFSMWFANLDKDQELEMIEEDGYEDGSTFTVYDQDKDAGKLVSLFQFISVIMISELTLPPKTSPS